MSTISSAKPTPTLKSLPADMELVLKVIPMPADCNANRSEEHTSELQSL